MVAKLLRINLNKNVALKQPLSSYTFCYKHQIRFVNNSKNGIDNEGKGINNKKILITKLTQILQCEARYAYMVYKEIKYVTPLALTTRVTFMLEQHISTSTIIEYPFLMAEDLGTFCIVQKYFIRCLIFWWALFSRYIRYQN